MGSVGSVDIPSLRRQGLDRPPRAYEHFVPPRGSAKDVLTTGWAFRGQPPFGLTPPIDWQAASSKDRSWNFALNAWRPLNTLLAAHSGSGEVRYLDAAVTLALHWIESNKHADDLTLVWYDQGHEILIGSGFNGYLGQTKKGSALHEQGFWYWDPRRVFVESTAAHNAVEIDGKSYDRKNRPPFGSAIEHWGTASGAHFVECRVSHAGGVEHRRLLINRLHHWLIVLDILVAEEPHAYRQWFHFAPALEVSADSSSRVTIAGLSVPLAAVSLVSGPTWSEPIKGQDDPMQGWWSPAPGKMEPNFAVAMEQARAGTTVFATLFAFGPAVAPDRGFNRVTDDGRSLRLRWQQAGQTHSVTVERPAGAETTLRYEAGR